MNSLSSRAAKATFGLVATSFLGRLEREHPLFSRDALRQKAAIGLEHRTSIAPKTNWLPVSWFSSREVSCSNIGGVANMKQVLFIECGFGNDQHGQNPTKAAIRACRNAIEFNSIPSIPQLVPGGYSNMKLHVQLGVPAEYIDQVELAEVAKVFPYGNLLPIELKPGGMIASSGIALEAMGDTCDTMIIVVACITVGY